MNPTPVSFHGTAGVLAADQWTVPEAEGTILLLHGGGQTRHSWRRSGPRFAAAGWTTVALDARGHGDSDWAEDGDYKAEAGHMVAGDDNDVFATQVVDFLRS